MAAPVAKVSILAEAATLEALKPLLGDIERMLKIEHSVLESGAPQDGPVEVQTVIGED